MKLTKSAGLTKDFRGCEFDYTVYSVYEIDGVPARHNYLMDRMYFSAKFPDIWAYTLRELKLKMSKIG